MEGLDRQTARLIAVGASVAANCQPCLETVVAKARQEEIKEKDIVEAIEIGKRGHTPVHISHFKASESANWGLVRQAVARIQKAREAGLKF